MKNPLSIFKPENTLKERVLKNKEAVLDIMSKNIQGARQCPFMVGQKCIGQFCELFMEFYNKDEQGNEKKFWRCAHVQTPILIIELNDNICNLIDILKKEKQ